MDSEVYVSKVKHILEDPTYEKNKKNQVKSIERMVGSHIRSSNIPK